MVNFAREIPDVPKHKELPTDPRAAWVHGWNSASKVYKDMMKEFAVFMDSTHKATIVNLHKRSMEPKTKKKPHKKYIPNPNNCPDHPVQYMSEGTCMLCARAKQYG